MLKLLRSSFDSEKAQFFIISAVFVVAVFALISTYLDDFGTVDTTSTGISYERQHFDNLKTEIETVIDASDEDVQERNLDDLKNYLKEKSFEKGIYLDINFTDPYDGSIPVETEIKIQSENVIIEDTFVY